MARERLDCSLKNGMAGTLPGQIHGLGHELHQGGRVPKGLGHAIQEIVGTHLLVCEEGGGTDAKPVL